MLRIFLASFAFTFRLISLFSFLLLHTVKKMQGNYVIVIVVVCLFAAKTTKRTKALAATAASDCKLRSHVTRKVRGSSI